MSKKKKKRSTQQQPKQQQPKQEKTEKPPKIADFLSEYDNATKLIKQLEEEALQISLRQLDIKKQLSDKASKLSEQEKERLKLEEKLLKKNKQQNDNTKNLLDKRREELTLTEDQLKARDKLAKLEKKVQESVGKSLGFLDDIKSKIEGIPIVGGVLSEALGIDDLKEGLTKDLTKQVMGAGVTFKKAFADAGGGIAGMGAGIKAIIPAIGQMGATLWASLAPILPIVLPIVAAVVALKAALDFDKEMADFSKDLNVSKTEAMRINDVAVDIGANMNLVGVNSEEVRKTMLEMNEAMGMNLAKMSQTNEQAKALLETSTVLLNKTGLTADEVKEMNTAAVATGIPMENMALMAESMGDELVEGKDIMKDLGKVSKGVLMNFKKNPMELVKAVKQAKLLGTTLDDMNAAGESMLDIESSLEAEMKANVLLGKHMNLTTARDAALRGDTVTVMEEIKKQMGSVADYEKMSVVQKKALAEALNLQSDELDGMMMKQKELEALGYSQAELEDKLKLTGEERAAELEKIGQLKGEEARKALEAKYAQEDQVAMMDKLKDIGTKLSDIFSKLFEPILAILSPIFDIISWLADIFIDTLKPVIDDIKNTFNEMFPATEGMGDTFKMIGTIIKPLILAPFRGIMAIINWVKESLKGIFEVFGGLKDIINGDIVGGLKKMGIGLMRGLLSPIQAIIDTAISFINMVIDAANAVIPGDGISPIGPFNMVDMMTGMAQGGTVGSGGMALVGEKGPEIVSLPSMATVSSNSDSGGVLSKLNDMATNTGSETVTATATSNQELVNILKQILTAVNQPAQIVIGNKAISELDTQINLKRSYNTKVDKAYGTFG